MVARGARVTWTRPGSSRKLTCVTLQLRPARPTDLEDLTRIYRSVRAEIGSHVADFGLDTAEETVLVAELDGRVVGFASVYPQESFLHHLYVDPRARGRGVGRALLVAATRDTTDRPWLKVDPANRAARAFYQRQGWVEDDPTADPVVVVRAPLDR